MNKLLLLVLLFTLAIFAESNSTQIIKKYSNIDFNNDGVADILWKKGSAYALWYMNDDGTHRYKSIGTKNMSYNVTSIADFNRDGMADILWRKGKYYSLWYMNEDGTHRYKYIGSKTMEYDVLAVADFNNDQVTDILWKKGKYYSLWYMNDDGSHVYKYIGSKNSDYTVMAVSDFNSDGMTDVLWKKGKYYSLWYMSENAKHLYKYIGSKNIDYSVTAVADFNSDGVADILWKKANHNSLWYMNHDGSHVYKNIGLKNINYKQTAVADFNNDGIADILWKKGNHNSLWYMNSDGSHVYKNIGSKSTDYRAITNDSMSNIDLGSTSRNNISVSTVKKLSSDVKETSGLAYVNGTLWTHNDSGGEPELYAIDSSTGSVSRTVKIANASNVDWEDLAFDDKYLYIGDFGNNRGKRKNLKIYKVKLEDLNNSSEVRAEIINFSYETQTEFSSTSKSNYNCEAFVAYEGSLYLFTKNHGNKKTDMYKLGTEAGTYVAKKVGTFNTKALVTGATIDPINKALVLIGYSDNGRPKTWIFTNFAGTDFFYNSKKTYIRWKSPYVAQIEGVTHIADGKLYISSEKNVIRKYGIRYTLDSKLYKLNY